MKKLALSLIAAALLAFAVSAYAQEPQYTFTFEKGIDTSSLSNTNASIGVYDGEVFFTSFTNQRLLKIADPLGASPAVSQLADLSAATTWPAGRGLTGLNIDPSNGDVYFAGDAGAADQGVLAVYSKTGTQIFQTVAFPDRLSSVAPYGGVAGTVDKVVVTYVLTSAIKTYDLTPPSTFAQTSISAAFTAPYNANIRDVAVNGDRIFYSRSGTNPDGYALVDASATPGSVASLNSTGLFQASGSNSVASVGVGVWDDGTTEWLIVPDLTAKKIIFVNTANTAEKIELQDAVNAPTTMRDACVANIGGSNYLFVTAAADPTATPPIPDKVLIFKINGAADVSDWTLF